MHHLRRVGSCLDAVTRGGLSRARGTTRERSPPPVAPPPRSLTVSLVCRTSPPYYLSPLRALRVSRPFTTSHLRPPCEVCEPSSSSTSASGASTRPSGLACLLLMLHRSTTDSSSTRPLLARSPSPKTGSSSSNDEPRRTLHPRPGQAARHLSRSSPRAVLDGSATPRRRTGSSSHSSAPSRARRPSWALSSRRAPWPSGWDSRKCFLAMVKVGF